MKIEVHAKKGPLVPMRLPYGVRAREIIKSSMGRFKGGFIVSRVIQFTGLRGHFASRVETFWG